MAPNEYLDVRQRATVERQRSMDEIPPKSNAPQPPDVDMNTRTSQVTAHGMVHCLHKSPFHPL